MKLHRLLFVLIAIGMLIVMSGCSEEKKALKNPFATATTSVSAMVAEPKNFMGKEVVIGPLELHENRVAEGYFEASPINEKGDVNYGASIKIFYKKTSDNAKLRDVPSYSRKVVYVKGKITPSKYDYWLEANEVRIVTEKK